MYTYAHIHTYTCKKEQSRF